VTRGDIVLVDLEPILGSEADKRRPAVIVSHDALNAVVTRRRQGVLTVVPLSTNVARVWSFQVFLPAEITGLGQDSKAQAEQVRALAYERFAPHRIATLPPTYVARLDAAMRLHLALG
jgi:mRNA interferase MazF